MNLPAISPPPQDSPTSGRKLIAPLLGIWLASWIILVILPLRFVPDFTTFAPLGLAFGQVGVSAAWLAFSGERWRSRGTVAGLLLCGALLGLTLSSLRSGRIFADGIVLLALAGQWILVQTPLWLIRWRTGLQIVPPDEVPDRDSRPAQFTLLQLMLTITVISVILGVGRFLALALRLHFPSFHSPDIVGFTLFVGFNLLLIWPWVWALLSPGRLWLQAALALAITIVVTAVETPAFNAFMPNVRGHIFLISNTAECLGIILPLAAIRWTGRRLVAGSV